MKSLTCLCTDIQDIPVTVILSNQAEVELLAVHLSQESQCGPNYQGYDTSNVAHLSTPPLIELVNLYDILPKSLRELTSEDSQDLLNKYGKFKYQTIKKLVAAAQYDYDYAVWLDSEGFVLRPFSMQRVISDFVKHPTIWHSNLNDNRVTDKMQEVMETAAHVLGRSIDTFGRRYWNLER